MEDPKVQELAEKLKEQGLAASMYEATEKAKSILNISSHKTPEKPEAPQMPNEVQKEVTQEPTPSVEPESMLQEADLENEPDIPPPPREYQEISDSENPNHSINNEVQEMPDIQESEENVESPNLEQEPQLPPENNEVQETQQQAEPSNYEDDVVKDPNNQDVSLNELMSEIGVSEQQVKEQEHGKIDKIIDDIGEVRRDIQEVQDDPEKVVEIRKDISKINEEVDEIVEERSEEPESDAAEDSDSEDEQEETQESSSDDAEKNIDISDVFNFNK
ncbi:hypothetical protein ISS07_02075 [Candidatus Woesearchaeota archaeon]|nr:hypothetical protein [Candidatus Woesearchaeota archaeon]